MPQELQVGLSLYRGAQRHCVVDDDDPLDHALDDVEDVRAVDDRLAVAGERRDQGLEHQRRVGVQALERLVEEDDLGGCGAARP